MGCCALGHGEQPADTAEAAARRAHDLRLLHACLAVATLCRLLSLMALSDSLADGIAAEGAPTAERVEVRLGADMQ